MGFYFTFKKKSFSLVSSQALSLQPVISSLFLAFCFGLLIIYLIDKSSPIPQLCNVFYCKDTFVGDTWTVQLVRTVVKALHNILYLPAFVTHSSGRCSTGESERVLTAVEQRSR